MGQKSPSKKSIKLPTILSFVIKQINRGIVPTRDEVMEVLDEVPAKYHRHLVTALLDNKEKIQVKPKVSQNTDDGPGLEFKGVPKQQPQIPKRPAKPMVDPNKPLTPGMLSAGANVLGNS